MPLIPEDILDDIQGRADIAELIGRYVPLKRAGRHFKANCPFHKERTPSFMVNTDKQVFHCFGCGVGGNIFSFLMQHDRLTFPEAVRQIADHVGVELPEPSKGGGGERGEELVPLMEQACQYFERLLRDPSAGRTARAYVKKRGVSDAARERFRLGVAPAGWNRLMTSAKSRGIPVDRLEAAGLVIQGDRRAYDRFRGRLMFPIIDLRGRVVGFGGRGLGDEEPKYLNSPETALYSKGRQLFGLAQAKEAILASKTAVLVEGYFDCIVLAGLGVAHVVSPLGTALTLEQARLLKRYAERVILAFDADAAGEQATLRGVDLLVELGLRVQIAELPAGVDPDECARAEGLSTFTARLERSTQVFEFLIETALRRFPGASAEQKVQAAHFVLPTIAKIPSAMLRSEYVRQLAQRLRLDEAAVAEELLKARPRTSAVKSAAPRPQVAAALAEAEGPERLLTALVLDEPSRWAAVQEQLTVDEIRHPALRRILSAVSGRLAAGSAVSAAQLVSRLEEEGHGPLISALVELAQSVPVKTDALDDCLRRIGQQAHKRQLAGLLEQLRVAQAAGEEMEVQRSLVAYQQCLKRESVHGGHRQA